MSEKIKPVGLSDNFPRATHDGPIDIAGREIMAAVLPDGRRLLTQGTFLVAIGRSRTPKAGTGGFTAVDGLPSFLQSEQIKPFITDDLRLSTIPIPFRLKSGQKSIGYNALLLTKVCEVYLKYRDYCMGPNGPGKIPTQYRHIVVACDTLMRGLAGVGIIALVDAATGYQDAKVKEVLERILNEYLLGEAKKYEVTFPLALYKMWFDLNHWEWKPENAQKRPGVIGRWTKKYIYARMAPGILEELEKRNPVTEKGYRKNKHFQFLTDGVGEPRLREFFGGHFALGKLATTWKKYTELVERAYPIPGDQKPLFKDIEE